MKQPGIAERLREAPAKIATATRTVCSGRVSSVSGLAAELEGLAGQLAVGDRVRLTPRAGGSIAAEVVGFRSGRASVMAFGSLLGVGTGAEAAIGFAAAGGSAATGLRISESWLGRVVDPLGAPVDGRGTLGGGTLREVRADPPQAGQRARLGSRISLGVRALDLFTTCRSGQRLGLFAGSGVGKSTLMAMLAQQAEFDVIVLALVGERGRELREFLEDDLGAEGLARSVVVVATSDQPPLMRREAAYAAMTVAEHFRDEGKSVLLLMDSVTRFCLALREIGLAAGEPPATRGYPPSVFAELPRLLERAGPGPDNTGAGHITAIFTVLVEGDDHNEPVADSVRGILDGHVLLDRRIGESGRYPAVDVLRSLSRTVPGCLHPQEGALVRRARQVLATQAELTDLVRLGAYQPGADPAADEALRLAPMIEGLLRQSRGEPSSLDEAFSQLEAVLGSVGVA
ncbi:MAG: flagellar protein export ATPase FliI [Acetobacteraceae bacterium]